VTIVRRGYFRVRRGFTTSGYTLALSSDSAVVAVLRLWDHGKVVSGSFDSEAQLKEVMGRYYRYVPELRTKGWLDDLDIHDWDEDQANPDATAAERQRRRRARLGTQKGRGSRRDSHGSHAVTVTDVTEVSRDLTETETLTETRTPRTVSLKPERARDSGSDDIDPDDLDPTPQPPSDVDPDDPPMAIPGPQLKAMDAWLTDHDYAALDAKDRMTASRFLSRHTGLSAADFIKTWGDAAAGGVRMRSALAIAMQKPGDGPKTRVELRMERRLEGENLERHHHVREAESAAGEHPARGESTAFNVASEIVQRLRSQGAVSSEG
jgi:hypothetical protein